MKQKINMVDITQKKPTARTAVATGKIFFSKQAYLSIKNGKITKGDPLNVAQIAGLLAAKNVPQTIPLTHPINITHCNIDLQLKCSQRFSPTTNQGRGFNVGKSKLKKFFVEATSTVKLISKTGPDIEAMYATAVALLTIYDMIKPIDPAAVISDLKLVQKTGGKSNFKINL